MGLNVRHHFKFILLLAFSAFAASVGESALGKKYKTFKELFGIISMFQTNYYQKFGHVPMAQQSYDPGRR